MEFSINDIYKAIAEVRANRPFSQQFYIYLYPNLIYNNIEHFYQDNKGNYYFEDGTNVCILPDKVSNKDTDYTVYIIPLEEIKPLKICYEGENNEIFNSINW